MLEHNLHYMFQMHKRFETPSSHSSFRLLGVCFVCVFVLCYTTTRTIFQILHFLISGETAHIAWCFLISGETAHIAWCFVINGDNCTHCLVSYYIFLPSLFMNNLMHESMTFLDNLYFMISHSIYSNFSQCSRKMKKYGTNDLVLPKYAVNNRVNAQSIICTYKENR